MRRLGLYLSRLPGFDKAGFDRKELIECVRAADECGYDSFWLPEAWERDAFTTLTELTTQTKHIQLGTGIVNVFSRSPSLLAMSAATLDEISRGRFRLGLGTSGRRVVEDFHGVPFERPLIRLREAVQIIRMLLRGGRVDFEGECFRLSRFKLGFKPVRAEIPIYIASLTQASLRQLGEIGDGWLPTQWPLQRLEDGVNEIRTSATACGRDPVRIDIAPFVNVVVSSDPARARNLARMPIAYYLGGMGEYYRASISRLGFKEEADKIRECWQSGRRKTAIAAVPDAMADALAICGSLESCRARLDELATIGATLPIVPIPGEGSTLEKCKLIEALIK
jgi:F420-dependent oxidoreductase-like protein